MPDEQRSLLRRCFTLAVEAFLLRFSGTQLAAWAGNPRTVSPCVRWDVRQECLSIQQGALAHSYSSTPVLESQASAHSDGANSSPQLETGDSLAHSLSETHYVQNF